MELPEKPTDLSIDVEQWNRDIQTFADTTKQALGAIVDELTNGCSGNARATTWEPSDMTVHHSLEPTKSQSPDRLSKLKSQLANRITKSS